MSTQLIRKAILLSWFTIAYNLVEGIASIAFGASDDSIALAGFGVDSLIEVASALLILWRFRNEAGLGSTISTDKERKATIGIGCLFLLLAAITAGASAFQIMRGSHPATTLPGLVISSISLSFMFWLWTSKRRVARQLDSASMLADAQCSLACIKLSGVVFLGSIVFLMAPVLWWVDSAAALTIAALIGKEGWETIEAAKHPDFSGGCGCGCKH